MFVAELRDDDSIEQVMNFAGTGHFVVATAHAGSLTEAMDRILRATDSRTSAQRAVVADRLHGLLHVQRSRPLASSKPGNEAASLRPTMLLPSLWKREGSGKHAFVGDGLSALLPSNPALLSDPAVNAAANNQEQRNRAERSPLDSSCLGRYWFAKQLFSNTKTENSAVRKEYESDALRFARNLDLER